MCGILWPVFNIIIIDKNLKAQQFSVVSPNTSFLKNLLSNFAKILHMMSTDNWILENNQFTSIDYWL